MWKGGTALCAQHSVVFVQRISPLQNKWRECDCSGVGSEGEGGCCSDICLIWSVDSQTATNSWVNMQFRALNPGHDESLMIPTQICHHIICPLNHFPLSAWCQQNKPNSPNWHILLNRLGMAAKYVRQLIECILLLFKFYIFLNIFVWAVLCGCGRQSSCVTEVNERPLV